MDLGEQIGAYLEKAFREWQAERRLLGTQFASAFQAWFADAWAKMPGQDWWPGFEKLVAEWQTQGVKVTDDSKQKFAAWLSDCEQRMRDRRSRAANVPARSAKPMAPSAAPGAYDVPLPPGYRNVPEPLPLGTEGPPPQVLRRDYSAGTLGPISPRVLDQLRSGGSGKSLYDDTIHVSGSLAHGRGVLVPVLPPEHDAADRGRRITAKEAALIGGSAAADFTPIVSQAKGVYEAAVGKDPITGHALSRWQRVLSLVGVIPFGAVFKLGKLGKVAGEAAKLEKAASELEKVALETERVAAELAKTEKAANELGKVSGVRVVDPSWKSKIQGTAHETGTEGHQFRSYREAITEAKKPEVEGVHMDHGYNRSLDLEPKTIQPNRRPDVISVYKDKSVVRIEVKSMTDREKALFQRNEALDSQIRAQGFKPQPPQVVLPTTKPK